MAVTEVYIDPSIAGDSGTGTVGDPYGDFQYALGQKTFDTTNGTRLNVKAGTAEILSATLDFSTNFLTTGNPTSANPLIIEGYTSTAGDGGIGAIDGNGSYGIISMSALDFVVLKHMHFKNSGSAKLVLLDRNITVFHCEFENTTGYGLEVDSYSTVAYSSFHNIGSIGFYARATCHCLFNYFKNGTNDFTYPIRGSSGNIVHGNIVDIDGSTDGIYDTGTGNMIITNNVFYSNAGTGTAIDITASGQGNIIVNNIIEGFSGVGGIGIDTDANEWNGIVGYNAFYNNTTNKNLALIVQDLTANDITLTASPFIDAANGDFRLKTGTGLHNAGYPTAFHADLSENNNYPNIGAIQQEWSMRRSRGLIHA